MTLCLDVENLPRNLKTQVLVCLAVILGFESITRRGHSWQSLSLRCPGTRGVLGWVLKPPPPPFLGDSLTTPQSSGVGASAPKSSHFCFSVALKCFYHFTSSAVLSLGILHCKITYNCCCLFFFLNLLPQYTHPASFTQNPAFLSTQLVGDPAGLGGLSRPNLESCRILSLIVLGSDSGPDIRLQTRDF